MACKGFIFLFWGFLFVLLDKQIKGLNIVLPDLVGYILFFVGLRLLSPLHSGFKKARALAMLMIPIALLTDFSGRLYPVIYGVGNTAAWWGSMVIKTVATLLEVTIVWQICASVIELAIAREHYLLAQDAQKRRVFFVGVVMAAWCGSAYYLALPKSLLSSSVAITLFLSVPENVFFALNIVVICLMMDLMKRSSIEIGYERGQQPRDLKRSLFQGKLLRYRPYVVAVAVVSLAMATAACIMYISSDGGHGRLLGAMIYLETGRPLVEIIHSIWLLIPFSLPYACLYFLPLWFYCYKRSAVFLVIQAVLSGALAAYGRHLSTLILIGSIG
jgi:hypothetical protein